MTDDLAIRLVRCLAMTTAAAIKGAAMQAENTARALRDEAPAYGETQFLDLIIEHGLDWNSIVGDTRP